MRRKILRLYIIYCRMLRSRSQDIFVNPSLWLRLGCGRFTIINYTLLVANQIVQSVEKERNLNPESALPDWSTGLISAYFFQHPYFAPTNLSRRCKGNNNFDSMNLKTLLIFLHQKLFIMQEFNNFACHEKDMPCNSSLHSLHVDVFADKSCRWHHFTG